VVLCLSHKKRMLLNHAMNLQKAELCDGPVAFIPCTKSKTLGVTMLPQDMKIWEGIELIGCIHQSNSKTVINGVLYVVKGWDAKFVYINVHPQYQKQPSDDSDAEPEEEPDEDDEDLEEDPAEGEIPADLKLSYENASKWLRLTHARCYGSIQGCTMEKQHILLADTRVPEGRRRHFTLRHLIVGVSRATHHDFVHVDPVYEAAMMRGARMYASMAMGPGGVLPSEDVDDDDDANDLALYCNDPADIPWDELRPPVAFDADGDVVM